MTWATRHHQSQSVPTTGGLRRARCPAAMRRFLATSFAHGTHGTLCPLLSDGTDTCPCSLCGAHLRASVLHTPAGLQRFCQVLAAL
jgi:hypothetical protein